MSTGPGRPVLKTGGDFKSLIIGTAAATGLYAAWYFYERTKYKRKDEPTYLERQLRQTAASEGTAKPQGAH